LGIEISRHLLVWCVQFVLELHAPVDQARHARLFGGEYGGATSAEGADGVSNREVGMACCNCDATYGLG